MDDGSAFSPAHPICRKSALAVLSAFRQQLEVSGPADDTQEIGSLLSLRDPPVSIFHRIISSWEMLIVCPAEICHVQYTWLSFRPGDMSTYAEALQESHGRVVIASALLRNKFTICLSFLIYPWSVAKTKIGDTIEHEPKPVSLEIRG